MCNCYLIFVVLVIIFSEPVMSSWEFAVSTKAGINYYTSDWKLMRSAIHHFDESPALTFDETEETLYFNDHSNQNWTIYSLKLTEDENHNIQHIVRKLKNEKVQGIALDPLERDLYWTDSVEKTIRKMSLDKQDESSILFKLDGNKVPKGIAIDVCRRKLYFTNVNTNPSIEQISLDGTHHTVLIDGPTSKMHFPSGIKVDQYSRRIFWVDDLQGHFFSVESANLDGSDRRIVVTNTTHTPKDIAVDQLNVYWTDEGNNAVWSAPKNPLVNDNSHAKVQSLKIFEEPNGIIARDHFLTSQRNNLECKNVIQMLDAAYKMESTTAKLESTSNFQCLNNGELIPKMNSCKCKHGFTGAHCEVPVCFNYCISGTCITSENGDYHCKCHPGFAGARCEIDTCTNYCLNDGRCLMENDERICRCPASYYGHRCEKMDVKEMCTRYCNKEDIDEKNFNFEEVCNNCSGDVNVASMYAKSGGEHLNSCKESKLNTTAIFVSCGVVTSLALVVIIVITIRRVYKPLHPRIKKTYVVHKNVTPTPMTCRPTTEQCEITIENCCNMNICDTPCFDPKTLQAEANKKEDKKTLLNHSEDLMY